MTWAHKARGSEAGEPDETGFPREGYALGDLAGAVSLSIPMEVYEAEARERTMANVSLFGALAVSRADGLRRGRLGLPHRCGRRGGLRVVPAGMA